MPHCQINLSNETLTTENAISVYWRENRINCGIKRRKGRAAEIMSETHLGGRQPWSSG